MRVGDIPDSRPRMCCVLKYRRYIFILAYPFTLENQIKCLTKLVGKLGLMKLNPSSTRSL